MTIKYKTIKEIKKMISSKEISNREITLEAYKLIEENKNLNAFITLNKEDAIKKAEDYDNNPSDLPLAGIPIAQKDLFCTKGIRTTCGSNMLSNFVPPYSATVIENLENAGCISIGKTNMDEFAMGSSNETSFYGNVHNPWGKNLVPGGSSGGSASAIAAGIVPAASGTDTGGSIRQPASVCGITGIKPTYGRISRWGMIAFASSLDQAGPMARTAEDCAFLLNEMCSHDSKDTTSLDEEIPNFEENLSNPLDGKKIGIVKDLDLSSLDDNVIQVYENSLKEFVSLGAKLVDISLPNLSLSVPTYYVVAPAECSSNLSRFDGVKFGRRSENTKDLEELYVKTRSEGFGDEVKRRILIGSYVLSAGYYDAYYKKAQQVRRLIKNDFDNAFSNVDVIMTPTTRGAAFEIGSKGSDPIQMYLEDLFTISANLAGLPAMSLPNGNIDNKPIGLQIIGNFLDEPSILNFAHMYQTKTDWHLYTPEGMKKMTWETVIGLEIHAQLSTKSKLFSGGSTKFGAESNTHVDLVDMGLPGVLPVANKEAFYKAIRFGLATGAKINQISSFDRKNYFYPDLPKGYQITQMTKPIIEKGSIKILIDDTEKVINITRAHLEEDAGKSIHDLFEGETGIDLNRAGTPLLEIVSEPEISNAKEAVAYFKAVRQLVTFLDICDGNMAQGSMRCDVNVSVKRIDDAELGTRAELKNINSFKFIEKAINYEIDRQIRVIENGDSVVQETRLYDSEKNETRSMRSKEEANDYRYFPCPDLLPVVISDKELKEIKDNIPELPEEKEHRYISEIGLEESEAKIISSSKTMANMFEAASSKTDDTKLVAKWLVGDVSALLNKDNIEIDESNLSPENFGKLIERITDSTISGKIAKSVLEEIWDNGSDVDEIIKSKGLVQIQDESLLEEIAKKVIDSNPDQVAAYKGGKDKLFGFFVGQVMKETQGKANPKSVNDILKNILN